MADLQVAAAVTARSLDVSFTVRSGEVLALIGPNGAGKSTTAAVIAGLVRGDPATVRVGERVLTDTDHGVQVAVHDRRVGLLSQDPLLFPHLTALGNVQFAAGRGALGRQRALGWLEQAGALRARSRSSRAEDPGSARPRAGCSLRKVRRCAWPI